MRAGREPPNLVLVVFGSWVVMPFQSTILGHIWCSAMGYEPVCPSFFVCQRLGAHRVPQVQSRIIVLLCYCCCYRMFRANYDRSASGSPGDWRWEIGDAGWYSCQRDRVPGAYHLLDTCSTHKYQLLRSITRKSNHQR